MTELKEKALAKMLEEMNKPHDEVLDYIHNILCESEDEDLFVGIMVEGKTIANAFNKMMELAKKAAKSNTAFFSPNQGMGIVIDYFKGKETEVKPIIGVVTGVSNSSPTRKVAIVGEGSKVKKITEAIIKKHEVQKVEKPKEFIQTDMFGFIHDDIVATALDDVKTMDDFMDKAKEICDTAPPTEPMIKPIEFEDGYAGTDGEFHSNDPESLEYDPDYNPENDNGDILEEDEEDEDENTEAED